jgi:hypothetical protein
VAVAFGSSIAGASAQESTPAATPTFEITPAVPEQVETAQDIAITNEQRRMLEDGVITDDELRESIQGYLTCLDTAGYPVTLVSNGVIGQGYMVESHVSEPVLATPGVAPTPDMTVHKAELECYRTTRLPTEGVYMGQTVSTDDSPEALLVECLETSGVIDMGSVEVEDVTADLDLHDTDTVICMAYPHYRGGSLDLNQPVATPEP